MQFSDALTLPFEREHTETMNGISTIIICQEFLKQEKWK